MFFASTLAGQVREPGFPVTGVGSRDTGTQQGYEMNLQSDWVVSWLLSMNSRRRWLATNLISREYSTSNTRSFPVTDPRNIALWTLHSVLYLCALAGLVVVGEVLQVMPDVSDVDGSETG